MSASTLPPKPVTSDILDEGKAEAYIPYPPIGENLCRQPPFLSSVATVLVSLGGHARVTVGGDVHRGAGAVSRSRMS
ncbi:MAG: hypothetical protein ACRDUY_05985, partial [Nitriliruptorales bacterium]